MAASCTACIVDSLAAKGAQTRQDLRTQCRAQATPYDNLIFAAAVTELVSTGKVIIDGRSNDANTWFDLS